MNLKKTEFITFRTDSEMKAQLEEIAIRKSGQFPLWWERSYGTG